MARIKGRIMGDHHIREDHGLEVHTQQTPSGRKLTFEQKKDLPLVDRGGWLNQKCSERLTQSPTRKLW